MLNQLLTIFHALFPYALSLQSLNDSRASCWDILLIVWSACPNHLIFQFFKFTSLFISHGSSQITQCWMEDMLTEASGQVIPLSSNDTGETAYFLRSAIKYLSSCSMLFTGFCSCKIYGLPPIILLIQRKYPQITKGPQFQFRCLPVWLC